MSNKKALIEAIKKELADAPLEVLRFIYAYILYFKR